MSNLTYKVKHGANLTSELKKAKLVADFAVKFQAKTSKDVKQFGLQSMLTCQIIRKYTRNKKCKKVNRVKLAVSNQGVKLKNGSIYIPCLKLTIPFNKPVEKVCQVELDETYAHICCLVKDEPPVNAVSYIGVDLNATGHIAVAAVDGKIIKLGKEAPHIHKKYQGMRKWAQRKRAFKFVKKLKNKESRKVKNINHQISRKLVNIAKEKSYGIKLEKLTGIRGNKKKGKKLNGIVSNWSFAQLQQFIEYKAKLCGVSVYYIDPAYTSQRCSRCGLIGDRNRKVFTCKCGHKDHADANAAFNIGYASITPENFNKDRDLLKGTTDSAQIAMESESTPTIKLPGLEAGE